MALVSMIIPCYNLENYIVECIKSVETQTFRDFDIIVVDDGSKDNSVNKIKSYIRTSGSNNIELVCKKNGGASSARNEGLKYATGKYVGFIDGDDFIDKDYLKNRIEALAESDADLCVGGIRTYKDKSFGQDLRLEKLYLDNKKEIESNLDKFDFMFIDPIGKLYKKTIIENNAIRFDERLKVAEDIAFALDYFEYVNKAVLLDDCTYNYRIRSDSLIHQVTLPTKQKFVWDHFVYYFENKNADEILKNNPGFCLYAWNFGLLNRIQSNVLLGEDIRKITESELAQTIIRTVKTTNKKDKLFLWLLENKTYPLAALLIRLKYFLLTKSGRLYDFAKKIMLRE